MQTKAGIFICTLLVLLLFPALDGMAKTNGGSSKELYIVGGNSAYPPYEFLDKEGKPAGFVVDLTRAIAETMGFDVRIRLGESWTDMRNALEREEIDILQGISYSADRDSILDFSPPHSFISHSIFARRGAPTVHSLDELGGKEVVLLGRGVMHDYFVQTGLQVIPVPAQTVAAALKLLASGKYDYAVLATLPGTYLISERGIDNVDLVSKGIDTKKYCYAVKDGNKAVLAKFSEGLAILKQTGRYRELQDKWLADAESEIGPWPWLARHRLVIVASLVLVLAASIVWSASLTRQVAIRTAALEHEVEERKRAAEELRRNQVALEHEVEERKRAAEELKLQQQQLIQADKMAALGVLVSGMAHEINNPNGLILLNLPAVSEVIRDSGPILEEYHRTHGDFTMGGLPYSKMRNEVPFMVEEMQDAAKRIKRIVDDLKHFSRRSDASFDELVDLNKVVQTSLRLVDNPLRKATNHYNAHYVEPLPKVKGNFQRLEQVIVNLILNARQALESPDKGILVSTMYDRTTGNVIVKVNDEGVGIPPEHLPRLTDPFFTTKRETGGTGLGLSISAGIIREHGGTIRFESQPGKGTTVIVTLPVASEDIS